MRANDRPRMAQRAATNTANLCFRYRSTLPRLHHNPRCNKLIDSNRMRDVTVYNWTENKRVCSYGSTAFRAGGLGSKHTTAESRQLVSVANFRLLICVVG